MNIKILPSCSQYFKDTKKEAIHNDFSLQVDENMVVPNTSKILKRKQFTTVDSHFFFEVALFPILQRY